MAALRVVNMSSLCMYVLTAAHCVCHTKKRDREKEGWCHQGEWDFKVGRNFASDLFENPLHLGNKEVKETI